MTQYKIPPQLLASLTATEFPRYDASAAPLCTRLAARLRATRLDREIDRCAAVHPGTALAVHVARLTGPSERQRVAAGLRSAPVDRPGARPVQDLVDDITLRLHAPRPLRALGVARLRLLLADAGGPLYAAGRGSLPAELRGVLAAL